MTTQGIKLSVLLCLAAAASACGPGKPAPEESAEEERLEPVGDGQVPELVQGLTGADAEECAERLSRCSPACFPFLEQALRKNERAATLALLEVLAFHRDPGARPLIRDLALDDGPKWRRLAALEVMASIAPREGVEFVLPLGKLTDRAESKDVRLAAAKVLESQPAPPLAARLLEMLADEDEEAAAAAAAAISSLASRHEESGERLAREIDLVDPEIARTRLARALVAAGLTPSRTAIGALLRSSHRAVRLEAVRTVSGAKALDDPPPGLYRALADEDPEVRAETRKYFESRAFVGDAPEILRAMLAEGTDGERKKEMAGLAGRLCGREFSGDEDARAWIAGWIAGRIDPFPEIHAPVSVPLAPVKDRGPGGPPLESVLAAAVIALLSAAGLVAGSALKKGAAGPDEPPGGAAKQSFAVRAGKWIFDNRIAVLLPWFIPPLVLFEQARLPHPGFRLALYLVAAAGAAIRIWATGFRTWAYRSSGDRRLMTSGPYSFVRHPLYLVNFMLSLPLFFIAGPLPYALAFIAWYGLTHMAIVIREDETVKAKYGAEWVEYASKVRRFIPRLTPYGSIGGGFSFEPVLKGWEIPKAVAVVGLLAAAFELFPRWLDLAALWLRSALTI